MTLSGRCLALSHLPNATSLPAPHTGPDEHPPGEWASHIQVLPYDCVRDGWDILPPFLRFLVTLPPRREPMLRKGISWDAFYLNEEIGKLSEHVEAAYMFMVGRRVELECVLCQLGGGAFPYCVVIDYEDGQSECCNCLWECTTDGCWLLGKRGQFFTQCSLYEQSP
ncbi:hypothetical protein N7537_003273 [Penicillium hordei]|uniref:Uncharacterized protein n=1 Tax=Penicillium hordei TaxID=40994 RepID=A0AAD6MPS1_9EURO|nr:uncharacterized protein N7537_003273 [Penicillium hordei]KAJ5618159.1 hypothetical protein N7537_003273 [Penicillium hordei]